MLKVENLTKIYKSGKKQTVALNKINFELNKGDHLAVLGPNGSGKTTLVKLITQLSSPTKGNIFLNNNKINEKNKNFFGLMLGQSMLYHRLSVKHNLEYYSSLYNVQEPQEKINTILKELRIDNRLDDLVEDLSYGLTSKVAFARAVIHDPEILILDEPTNGLDPVSADELYANIKKHETVIFLTHNLDEALKLSNKILFLNQGKQIFFGNLNDFNSKFGNGKSYESIINKLKDLYET